MKKLLSLALVVAMLASMLVVVPTAGATEKLATIEVTNAVGVAGDTVSVNIVVTTATMSGYSLFFEYDKTRLELVQDGDKNATMPADWEFEGKLDSADGALASAEWTSIDYDGVAPFENIWWNDGDAIARDCTAGVAIAVLTFTIKEDAPAGDAYVGLRYLCNDNGYKPNEIYSGTSVGTISAEEDIEFKAGKVTVLPEGYVNGVATDCSKFEFTAFTEDGDDAWYAEDVAYVTISSYLGTDTNVVIPEIFTGFILNEDTDELEPFSAPVYEIDQVAFRDAEITSVVIPASVNYIGDAAFGNCESLTDAYVLGEEVEFGVKAFGWMGTIKVSSKGKVSWSGAELVSGFTLHCVADSATAEALGEEEFAWDGSVSALYNVAFGGITAYTTAETVAPGQMINGDKTVVAWKNGDAVLAPGAALTLTDDVVLEAIEITTPTLVNGVSIKVADEYKDSAMRFTANLAKADYEALAALGTVTVGTIITPVAYVNMAGGLTKAALDNLGAKNGAYIDVVASGFYTEGVVAGSVRNFMKKNVDVDYAAALYITVELADGTSFTVYSAYNHNTNRNFNDAIEKAVANDGITDAQYDKLTEWIAALK